MPQTFAMTAVTFDIVHGGNGFAYVFPGQTQWTEVHCINLATGAETLGTGFLRSGTVARRHPTRAAIYGADNGLSPADIELHDIANGTSQLLRDSPYHGDFAMCGDLWFSDDGNRIFTRCGNAFRSTTDPATDMTYNGSFPGAGYIGHIDDSQAAGQIAVLLANGWMETGQDTKIRLHEPQFLGFSGEISLPQMIVDSAPVQAAGRFVFWRADGTRLYTVVHAGSSDGVWAKDFP
jgi:hypothetical protein